MILLKSGVRPKQIIHGKLSYDQEFLCLMFDLKTPIYKYDSIKPGNISVKRFKIYLKL